MAALDQLRNIDNLKRAWRWIQSNADASYKSYFRSLYQNYAVAEDALLADLASRLKRGIYEPDVATKLFFPKASGVLRVYRFLCNRRWGSLLRKPFLVSDRKLVQCCLPSRGSASSISC